MLTLRYVRLDTQPVEDETSPELRSWLKAIGTLTAAVNAERDLKSLLDLVAVTAQDLLDLSFCAVMLPDEDEEYLSVAGASGLPDQYIARVNRDRPVRLEADPHVGAPASRAYRSRRPSMVRDVSLEPPSSWADVANEQGYRSILAVPLRTSAGVVGTLNSYRTTPHDFLEPEIAQLELLAEHAAVALTAARIMDDLRDKHRFIVRSEAIHDRLLNVAVRSGGVEGIASALNDLLACDVVIRDANGTILAAKPDWPDAARPAEPPASEADGSSPNLVREAGADVVADVILDGTSVATVWLLGRAGKLDALGIRAMEHASVVLGLEVLRQRTAAEVEQSLRGELLADLLAGADPAARSTRDRLGLMGHNLTVPHRMMVAVPGAAHVGGSPARVSARHEGVATQRAAAEAVRSTSHLKPRPLIAAVKGAVVALWPESHGVGAGDKALRRAIASTHDGATAALAVTTVDGHGIPAAYRGARGALAIAATEGDPRTVVTLEDLGAAGLLLQFAEPTELRRYAERTIGVLRAYDRDHSAALIETLRAYLSNDLDRRLTGEKLVLHPNTVSQRLRRIETLSGLDLRSPRSVIEARTALMLMDVADAVSAT